MNRIALAKIPNVMLYIPIALLFHLLLTCQPPSQSLTATQQSGTTDDPPACDCCVFDETKPRDWRTRIAPDSVRGQRMRIVGTVYESDGRTPARNVLMYFYHTNAQGYYAKLGTEPRTSHAWWHGYCRGWLRTDEQGRYEINTIRPGAYPRESIPAHIHFYVKAPSQRTCYYLSDFVFQGDPFVTESYWYQTEQQEGFLRYDGVALTSEGGTLVGRRDISLLPQYDRQPNQSGLRIGDNCPAFDPQHVWGPDRGKGTCPMCAYGRGQGLMIWTTDVTSETALQMARFLEAESRKRGSPFKAFIIYTNPDRKPVADVKQRLESFARQADLRDVSVLHVPAPDHKSTAFLYNIHPDAATTVLVYKQRTVIDKAINPAATPVGLTQLVRRL